MTEVVLHSFWRSSCSWRVRTALEMKRVAYRYVPVDLMKQRQHQLPEYSRVNPMQKVPSLLIDGRQISESYNIVMYLEETRAANPLLPREPLDRAVAREICEIIQSGIQPLQNVGILFELPFESEEKIKWAQKWITKGFHVLEKKLESSAGKYCLGDTVTIADLFLVPQVFNAKGFKVPVESFPLLSKVTSNLLTLEEFVRAHPYNQPDAPPEVRGSAATAGPSQRHYTVPSQ